MCQQRNVAGHHRFGFATTWLYEGQCFDLISLSVITNFGGATVRVEGLGEGFQFTLTRSPAESSCWWRTAMA